MTGWNAGVAIRISSAPAGRQTSAQRSETVSPSRPMSTGWIMKPNLLLHVATVRPDPAASPGVELTLPAGRGHGGVAPTGPWRPQRVGHGTPRGHDATIAVSLPVTVASLRVQTLHGSGPHRGTQRFRDTQKFSGKTQESAQNCEVPRLKPLVTRTSPVWSWQRRGWWCSAICREIPLGTRNGWHATYGHVLVAS